MKRALLFLWLAAALRAQDAGALGEQLRAIEQDSGGVLGVSAIHIERAVQVGWHARDRFPMMSVYKLPIAIGALAMMEAGQLPFRKWIHVKPEDFAPGHNPLVENYPEGRVLTVGQLLESMISNSDNTACDVLLKQVGGPQAVQALVQRIVKSGIRVDRSEREMADDFAKLGIQGYDADGRDSATPEAMSLLLMQLQRGAVLRPKTLELLKKWMTESVTGPRRIKGLLPKEVVVWHKTGTGWVKDGVSLATNDAGVLVLPEGRGHIALTVFLKLSTKDEAARERALAEAALAVYRFFDAPQPAK